MRRRSSIVGVLACAGLLLAACQPAAPSASSGGQQTSAPSSGKTASGASSGPTRVTIGQTNPLESQDPYNHSDTFLYPFWCEMAGCLVNWDPKTGEPVPELAESWTREDPLTWIFKLRQNVQWSDGSPFTAADVIHSLDVVKNHPAGKQKYMLATVTSYTAVDDHTVKIVTKDPFPELLDGSFTLLIEITSKAQADRGEDLAKVPALSTGPYMVREWQPNSQVVVVKNPHWWGGKVEGPDEVVYRYIKEDQARVTALLNNEIQIASLIPSQDVDRVNGSGNAKIAISSGSTENMFLGMSPKFKPWDNKLLRQAVQYAIDKDGIIKNVLQGYAERLDGPIGPGQYAYNPDLQPKYTYNPEKAKELVKQAGFPDGVEVELSTPVNMYTKDKEITEAMIPMLNAVGIKAKLLSPEWATLWANVQTGKVPFFYMGRGSFRDPGQPLSQYFETGVSPRLGFSDPALDELFRKERAAPTPDDRKKLLSDVMSYVQDASPAVFLWRHRFLWGVSSSIQWEPRPDGAIFANKIKVN